MPCTFSIAAPRHSAAMGRRVVEVGTSFTLRPQKTRRMEGQRGRGMVIMKGGSKGRRLVLKVEARS